MAIVKAPFTKEVQAIMERVGSRKRSAIVWERTADGETTVHLSSYWDGGSKSYYRAWDATGKELNIASFIGGAPGFERGPKPWLPQAGDVLVEYGTMMGKPSTPHITYYR